jgi:hypothetical protein
MSTKNSMTPSGIEPATFLFVAQYLNHCATAILIIISSRSKSKGKAEVHPRTGQEGPNGEYSFLDLRR